MWPWRRHPPLAAHPDAGADRIRAKYHTFRELLTLNNECLEEMAALQEDLRYVPPRAEVFDGRLGAIFERVQQVIHGLEKLTGVAANDLSAALQTQRQDTERYLAGLQNSRAPRLSAWLSEINAQAEAEAGGKAAMLGEIRNKLGLPVPEGFVLTTEAYRQYCGIPLWQTVRDATRDLDLNDLVAVREASALLSGQAMALALPRAVEVAISARSQALLKHGGTLAVRSSAVGEGGIRSYAGQFLSLLNVPLREAVDAYKQVIAARFEDRALFYRLSTGLPEVDSPMAVLFLQLVPARAAGVMYTRDPNDIKGKSLWITSTWGLGLDLASGRMPADLFIVSRTAPHPVLERKLVRKDEQLVSQTGGGVGRVALSPDAAEQPSIGEEHLNTLAGWGVAIENHFREPQDVEWVLDRENRLWIVQSRPLAHSPAAPAKPRAKPKTIPFATGGRTVYPGRTSGPVYLVDNAQDIAQAPNGAIVFVRRPSPEMIEMFPRIGGLVAEWGNIAGHAAALLREFQIPSVFGMEGTFGRLVNGISVSLDAVQAQLYPGILWPPQKPRLNLAGPHSEKSRNPIARNLLALNLLDPAGANFHPRGCQSAHDCLRYCHEKAIEAMFEVDDFELEHGTRTARQLATTLPLNIVVLDLGGALSPDAPAGRRIEPSQILSRPFQALWSGLSHPDVSWVREMPAQISDLASILSTAFNPPSTSMRPLGDKSYLLVAEEYLNLNARLAYHYSLVDACLSETPGNNYISFRFEGGGAAPQRRTLRACFLEKCLLGHGFHVDRREDLVNAWLRKAPADSTAQRLGILGRLMACSSQLDMFMNNREAMHWYAQQFMKGNYKFVRQNP
jgi:pyruvate,water dikinase